MAIAYLKKAARTAVSDAGTRSTVARILARNEVGGEATTRKFATELVGWHGVVRLAKCFPDERFELQPGEIT